MGLWLGNPLFDSWLSYSSNLFNRLNTFLLPLFLDSYLSNRLLRFNLEWMVSWLLFMDREWLREGLDFLYMVTKYGDLRSLLSSEFFLLEIRVPFEVWFIFWDNIDKIILINHHDYIFRPIELLISVSVKVRALKIGIKLQHRYNLNHIQLLDHIYLS